MAASKCVVKLPPEADGARDEGPRLIPLDAHLDHRSTLHFADLADIALRTTKNPKPKKR